MTAAGGRIGARTPAVEAMLGGLPPEALRELEQVLRVELGNTDQPRARRVAELGALAQMLQPLEPAPGWDYPEIAQADYDARRPKGAIRGAALADLYGNWLLACRAAYSMLPDGRRRGPARPWQQPPPGANAPYTREEVLDAIRQCARELGCAPTSTSYWRWSTQKRRRARERGVVVRVPSLSAIYRHLGKGQPGGRWRAAAAAAIAMRRS